MRTSFLAGGVLALASFAAPALGDTSSREVQSAVDAYLASAKADPGLVGGAGQAGYDDGFWIRGGTFLLKINLLLQTRWEGFDWDDTAVEPSPGGDLSGFSLPRAVLKFSGDATCSVHYYAELEFGHEGSLGDNEANVNFANFVYHYNGTPSAEDASTGPDTARDFMQEHDAGVLREGWIEYAASAHANLRVGLVATPTTRQLMTPPEMQQFVDISMASAFIGAGMPGYSDRNRDYGALFHGACGCDEQFQYMLAVTNGDGPVHRNVLDGETSDGFAYSARLNWDIKGHLGYEEGALASHECDWAASVGAWGHYYTDALQHNPYAKFADRLTWGVDAAFRWGGLSLTAAFSSFTWDDNRGINDIEGASYLVQAGYLFPGTAWELAARYSAYTLDDNVSDASLAGAEIGVAVNYYIDGHADKVTLDVAMISGDDDGNFFGDVYAGYSATFDSDAVMVRLQWQLAL